MLEGTEKWWQSRGILGGIVSTVSVLLGLVGYTVSKEDQELVVLGIVAIGVVISNAIGVYGRAKATKRIE